MATNQITVAATPDDVFAVLADGRSYERWLVGCKKIRDVDEGWPAPGTKIHHRVGFGPIELEDTTVAVETEPPRRLKLRARARPLGVAEVVFDLAPTEDGLGTEVTMVEYSVKGPAKVLHNKLLDLLVSARNAKSLQRLRDVVEERVKAGG